MEIRINKQWVIYTAKNGSGVILGKIPEHKQDDAELDVTKLGGSNLYHYATVFGAVQGLFKYGVNDTDARSFAELEAKIERIAQECQSAFIKSQSAPVVPEGFVLVGQKDLLELTIAINAVDLATHTESKTNEVREMWQQVALKLMALGAAQEQN